MKFTADPKVLSRALRLVGGVIDNRPAHPALVNVLLWAGEDRLFLAGTNTEVEAHVDIPLPGIKADDNSKITLPAKKLTDALMLIKDQSKISLESSDAKATLKSGRNVYRFATVAADLIPLFEDEPNLEFSFEIASAKMLDMLQRTAFSMAQQDTRYFLNGALFEVTPYHFRVVTSDGHRLAMYTHIEELDEKAPQKLHAIVPRKAIIELIRFLEESNEVVDKSDKSGEIKEVSKVRVEIGEHQVSMKVDGKTIKSKLIDGQFPEYERVLPKNITHELDADRVAIHNACQQAAVLNNEEHGGVVMRLDKDQQHSFQSQNILDESAEIFFEANLKGDKIEVAFKATYLRDILNALGGEKVKIKLQDNSNSGLIQSPDRDDVLYVVMPLRL